MTKTDILLEIFFCYFFQQIGVNQGTLLYCNSLPALVD